VPEQRDGSAVGEERAMSLGVAKCSKTEINTTIWGTITIVFYLQLNRGFFGVKTQLSYVIFI
jgi:hypothetical protein